MNDSPFTGTSVSCSVSQCTFANNTDECGNAANGGTYGGGAIETNPGATLTVLSSLFTGNQVNNSGGDSASGGAIDTSTDISVTITGCQFISNTSIASSMGGYAQAGAVDNFQTMSISDCQFINNTATSGGGPCS